MEPVSTNSVVKSITFVKGGERFKPLTGLSTTDNGFGYTIMNITPVVSEGGIAKARSIFFLFTTKSRSKAP